MTSTTDAALDAQLKTVLDRESATHFRHDARVEALEIERDAAYARGVHDVADLIHRVADGYDVAGDRAIACGLYLTEGNARALADAPPVPVARVKPLVFKDGLADSIVGRYGVECSSFGRWFVRVPGANTPAAMKTYGSEFEAVEALQADYEARILAALQPQAKGGDA